jgi:peptide/nickel transport system substrate-binding protein
MRIYKIVPVATLALLLGVLGAEAQNDPSRVINVAETIPPSNLDPQQSTIGADWQAWQLGYQCLLTTDASGAIQPQLAESYTVSDDNKTYDFKLRPNVFFHNGDALSADDVIYSFARLKEKGVPLLQGRFYPSLQSVTADGDTVRFTLGGPDPSFIRNMASPGVAGCAILDRNVPEESLAQKMVGTGPYYQTGYVPNQELNVRVFDRYWGEKPKNAGVRVLYIPDGFSQLANLRSGKVDLFFPAAALLKPLESDKSVVLESTVTDYIDMITINTSHAPFDDVRVRRAIALAIDRQAIANTVYSGAAVPTSYLPPRWPWVAKVGEAPYSKQDIAQAKALLAEAGHPDGFDAHFMYIASRQEQAASAAVIQSQLAAIGIKITLDAEQQAVWSEKLNKPDYDLSFNSYFGFANPYEFLRVRTTRTGPIPQSLADLTSQLPATSSEQDFQNLVLKIAEEEGNLVYPNIPTVALKGYVAHVPALGNVVAPADSTRHFLTAVTVSR